MRINGSPEDCGTGWQHVISLMGDLWQRVQQGAAERGTDAFAAELHASQPLCKTSHSTSHRAITCGAGSVSDNRSHTSHCLPDSHSKRQCIQPTPEIVQTRIPSQSPEGWPQQQAAPEAAPPPLPPATWPAERPTTLVVVAGRRRKRSQQRRANIGPAAALHAARLQLPLEANPAEAQQRPGT